MKTAGIEKVEEDVVGCRGYTANSDMFTASGSEQAFERVNLGNHKWVVRGYVAIFEYLDVGGSGIVDVDENGIIDLRR